jgi:hypothetical protein
LTLHAGGIAAFAGKENEAAGEGVYSLVLDLGGGPA